MRFRLNYRGPLASNGTPRQKWDLRLHFAKQLDVLWNQEPLSQISKYRDGNYRPNDCYVGIERNGINFFPLVTEKLFTVAELDILMLRPGEPGHIAGGGGDIDNRLKTLLDSFQPPVDSSTPANGIMELNCLSQDDKLFTRVNVETDRLLDNSGNQNEVILIIKVHIRASSGRMCNLGITS